MISSTYFNKSLISGIIYAACASRFAMYMPLVVHVFFYRKSYIFSIQSSTMILTYLRRSSTLAINPPRYFLPEVVILTPVPWNISVAELYSSSFYYQPRF